MFLFIFSLSPATIYFSLQPLATFEFSPITQFVKSTSSLISALSKIIVSLTSDLAPITTLFPIVDLFKSPLIMQLEPLQKSKFFLCEIIKRNGYFIPLL